MGNYSVEEIAAFGRKDLLNSRMSAVKATSVNFEGKSASFKEFKDFADKLFSWVQQDQLAASGMPEVKGDVQKSGVIPTPTADQKKVLDVIIKRLRDDDYIWDRDFIYEKVLLYSTAVVSVEKPTYPTNLASVDKICKWIQNN